MSSSPEQKLPVERAQVLLDELREQHGLGQKYRRIVESSTEDRWLLRSDSGDAEQVPSMTRSEWLAWLERYFIEAITEHDKTEEG